MEASEVSAQVESQLGLRICSVDAVKTAPGNLLYRLRTEGRSVFLKLRIDAFSRARVAEEAAFIRYLNGRGFNAPGLVANASGGSLFQCTLDGRPRYGYVMDEVRIELPGIDLDDEAHLRMAARKLAEFHTISDELGTDFTVVDWDHRGLVDRNLRVVEPLFARRRRDFDAICASFDRVKGRLARTWEKNDGSWGVVHGDLHATNMVIGADGDLWLLDFESFGNGWRMHDVVYLLGDTVGVHGPLDLAPLRGRYDVFVDEYAKLGSSLGETSELPTAWLAVRLLLQTGRHVGFLRASDPDASLGDSWIDAFIEKTDTLTHGW